MQEVCLEFNFCNFGWIRAAKCLEEIRKFPRKVEVGRRREIYSRFFQFTLQASMLSKSGIYLGITISFPLGFWLVIWRRHNEIWDFICGLDLVLGWIKVGFLWLPWIVFHSDIKQFGGNLLPPFYNSLSRTKYFTFCQRPVSSSDLKCRKGFVGSNTASMLDLKREAQTGEL